MSVTLPPLSTGGDFARPSGVLLPALGTGAHARPSGVFLPLMVTGAHARPSGLLLPALVTGEAPVFTAIVPDVGVSIGLNTLFPSITTDEGNVGLTIAGGNGLVEVYIEEGNVEVTLGLTHTMATIHTIAIDGVGLVVENDPVVQWIDRVLVQFIARYGHPIKASLASLYSFTRGVAFESIYSLIGSVQAELVGVYESTARVPVALTGVYDLAVNNPVSLSLLGRYSLSESSVQVIAAAPYITAGTRRIELVEASVSTEADNLYWTARLRVAKMDDFYSLTEGDPITLHIGVDEWELVVETLAKNRSKRAQVDFDVSALSPAWLLMGANSEPVSKVWGAVSAREVVEEMVGTEVDWQIIDWIIPANRLSVAQVLRADVAKRVVETAGAVLESMPDGSMRARYTYPVSLPSAAGATLDHELFEGADIITLQDTIKPKRGFNAVTLSDESGDFGFMQAERDPFQNETVLPEETQRYVVWLDDKTEIVETILSDGTLVDLGERIDEFEEQLTFSNSNTAQLRKPVHSDFAYTWYGAGLGALTVGTDARTVTAAAAGVAIARVTYKARARVFGVQAPASSGGRTLFPILVYVVGAIA